MIKYILVILIVGNINLLAQEYVLKRSFDFKTNVFGNAIYLKYSIISKEKKIKTYNASQASANNVAVYCPNFPDVPLNNERAVLEYGDEGLRIYMEDLGDNRQRGYYILDYWLSLATN